MAENNMTDKNYYTIWSWYDAPYTVRLRSPMKKGTWIVRVEPGHNFPTDKLAINNKPAWEVVGLNVDDRWYVYINDPENRPWPRLEVDMLEFGSESSVTVLSEVDCPPDK